LQEKFGENMAAIYETAYPRINDVATLIRTENLQ